MREAIAEARRGVGRTHPNPAVGAVIVKGGRVIARGFHHQAGTPHAEAHALAAAGTRAKGATLYSTLEPCNHFGRTPPCSQAIIAAGISRVVYASSDPNPLVDGKGHRTLARAGVDVVAHVLRDEADLLNRPFFKAMRTGLPWVTLKAALSLDGKIATASGDSRWISSDESRRLVHRMRNLVDAILVGAGTVEADDPRLTTRLEGRSKGHSPVRVVVDPSLRTQTTALVYRPDQRRIVVTTERAAAQRGAALSRRGVEVWALPAKQGRFAMKAVLKRLVREGLLHVLVEGGAEVYSSMLAERLVDEFALFVAPRLLGAGALSWSGTRVHPKRVAQAPQLEFMHAEHVGPDLFVTARPVD